MTSASTPDRAEARGGRPLDAAARAALEPRFAADFSTVRVHLDASGPPSALGWTRGEDLHFAPGQYRPAMDPGRHLIAHELAHVLQQRRGRETGITRGALELEADRAAAAGVRAVVDGAAAPGAVQYSRLSDAVRDAPVKGRAFDALRDACPLAGDVWSAAGALVTDGDTWLTREIDRRFRAMPDDLWLAQTIRRHGPEPLWPVAAIVERARRANAPLPSGRRAWEPEPGNIGVAIDIPDRAQHEASIAPIRAYFFPGRSGRRALIVGGIHGTEPQGTEVVDRLRAHLAVESAAGRPPFFTTILVPTLIERIAGPGSRYPGETGAQAATYDRVAQAWRAPGAVRGVEPNRTYPGMPNPAEPTSGWAGQDYRSALRRGLLFQEPGGAIRAPRARPQASRARELAGDDVQSSRMIAETRALVALIERFQPERLASVHAHHLIIPRGSTTPVPRRGNDPGVFVDPRGGYLGGASADPTVVEAATAEGRADDALARAMLARGLADRRASSTTFLGNTAPRRSVTSHNVHYAADETPEGTSMAGWATARGITTITVEVPQEIGPAERVRVEELHRELLELIFLGDPATQTRGMFVTPTPMRGRSTAPVPSRRR